MAYSPGTRASGRADVAPKGLEVCGSAITVAVALERLRDRDRRNCDERGQRGNDEDGVEFENVNHAWGGEGGCQ